MSTKQASVGTFLSQVAEEKRGFKFGEPERIQEDGLAAVVPILRKTSIKRQYITFPEIGDKVSVKDTGRIDQFSAINTSDENVFVRAGTIFKGNTQERALVRSAILFPGKTANIEVRCVHKSKGISPGASTSYGGITPFEMDQRTHLRGYKPVDQGSYWQSVSAYSACVGGHDINHTVQSEAVHRTHPDEWIGRASLGWTGESRHEPVMSLRLGGSIPRTRGFPFTKTDDLHSTINEFAANIDDVLKRVKRQANQVGIGIITDKGCQTIELFDLPASWSALHNDAVRRVGQDLSRKGENVFDYKPQFALSTMAAVLADTYAENTILEHRPSNGEPPVRIIGLTSERFLGEVVEIEGRIIHIVLNRLPN